MSINVFSKNNFNFDDNKVRGLTAVTNKKNFLSVDEKELKFLKGNMFIELKGSRDTEFRQDISVVSGDTIEIRVDVTDRDGDDLNVSSSDLTYKISDGPNLVDTTVHVTKERGSGITQETVPDTSLIITIDPTDTESLSGLLFHELEERSGGSVHTLFQGSIRVRADVVE